MEIAVKLKSLFLVIGKNNIIMKMMMVMESGWDTKYSHLQPSRKLLLMWLELTSNTAFAWLVVATLFIFYDPMRGQKTTSLLVFLEMNLKTNESICQLWYRFLSDKPL